MSIFTNSPASLINLLRQNIKETVNCKLDVSIFIDTQPVTKSENNSKDSLQVQLLLPRHEDFVLSSMIVRHVAVHRLPCQGLHHIVLLSLR